MDDLHYYTTGIKFGRGRATEDAAQEIRSGEINREEGIQLVKRYDLEYPDRFEKELFQYLSIPSDEFPTASKMFEEPIMSKNISPTFQIVSVLLISGDYRMENGGFGALFGRVTNEQPK